MGAQTKFFDEKILVEGDIPTPGASKKFEPRKGFLLFRLRGESQLLGFRVGSEKFLCLFENLV